MSVVGPRRFLVLFVVSMLGTINSYASPGSGEGEGTLFKAAVVSVITRLRKSEISFVCGFRLISAKRIL